MTKENMTEDIIPTATPYELVMAWLEDAKQSEPTDPDAACLATIDKDGLPNARVILVRQIDENGFCFFTNRESAKGNDLKHTPKAALNFHWKSLKRQIRIRGTISPVTEEESDTYYNSRPLGNRIGAWASRQSRPLDDRQTLIDRTKEYENKYGEHPPRPDYWGGYRLSPLSVEFWQEGQFRLHHRLLYTKTADGWVTTKLFP